MEAPVLDEVGDETEAEEESGPDLIITLRPKPERRVTRWEVDCSECGPVGRAKPFGSKAAARKGAAEHRLGEHPGMEAEYRTPKR